MNNEQFNKFICKFQNEDFMKFILITDIQNLIISIKQRIIETKSLFILFYKELCNTSLDIDVNLLFPQNDIFVLSGEKTTVLFSFLENFLVKLYSIFDLLSKIYIEKKTKYQNFHIYNNLKSKNCIYGSVKIDDEKKDTIFSKDKYINLLINLRNEIIHNGSLIHQNTLYLSYENNKFLKEKFILLMDTNNGNLETLKNRKRFYSQERKLNYLLPSFYLRILEKIRNTIFFVKGIV